MRRQVLKTAEYWHQWAERHHVLTEHVEVVETAYGNGLRSKSLFTEPEETLLVVPSHLVLNIDYVQDRAKCDYYLAIVLDALGEFGQVGQKRSGFRFTPKEPQLINYNRPTVGLLSSICWLK